MLKGLVRIGKLTRPHGIKGAVLLSLGSAGRPDTSKAKVFFVEINGVQTPFFVTEIKMLGKNLALQFDNLKTIEQAQKVCGANVWLEEKNLLKEKKQKDFAGYRLIDAVKGDLGEILEVVEMPGQRMFSLEVKNKEVLLPFNEELIEKTDNKNKTIYYHAPEGLIDIYLGQE
jgi:16S rRNA processing protein RimM